MFKELFYSPTEQIYAYIRYLVSQGTNYYTTLTHILRDFIEIIKRQNTVAYIPPKQFLLFNFCF